MQRPHVLLFSALMIAVGIAITATVHADEPAPSTDQPATELAQADPADDKTSMRLAAAFAALAAVLIVAPAGWR